MADGGNVVPAITKAEHIGPDSTGDNINAKRAANYTWDGSNWQRQAQGLIPVAFDRITFSNPNSNSPVNYQTGTVKKSGATVGSLTLSYDASGTLTDVQFTAA